MLQEDNDQDYCLKKRDKFGFCPAGMDNKEDSSSLSTSLKRPPWWRFQFDSEEWNSEMELSFQLKSERTRETMINCSLSAQTSSQNLTLNHYLIESLVWARNTDIATDTFPWTAVGGRKVMSSVSHLSRPWSLLLMTKVQRIVHGKPPKPFCEEGNISIYKATQTDAPKQNGNEPLHVWFSHNKTGLEEMWVAAWLSQIFIAGDISNPFSCMKCLSHVSSHEVWAIATYST